MGHQVRSGSVGATGPARGPTSRACMAPVEPVAPNNDVTVRIDRLDPSIASRYETAGSAGFDLAASADMTIAPGEVALVPTGLVIEVPAGPLPRRLRAQQHAAQARADGRQRRRRRRCGLLRPKDEIKIEVLNFTAAPVAVRRGDRLAQGVILPFVEPSGRNRTRIDRPTRGGFGSTGRSAASSLSGTAWYVARPWVSGRDQINSS